MTKDNTHEAYAIGYYHGRLRGVESNFYGESALRVAYTFGFERGVRHYTLYDRHESEKNTLQK
jgi:hypothetical protein